MNVRMLLSALTLLVGAAAQVRAQPVTVVAVTDEVVVSDCGPFGINLGGDAYYSGAVLVKKRVRQNFEGTSYRQCHFGPFQDETGAATWFNPPDAWRDILVGGRYTILSGPAKGTTGTIADITTKQAEHQGRMKDFGYFVFDKTVPAGPPNGGLLVETMRLDEGQFRRFENHDHWTTHENRIEIGDVPPESFGQAALALRAANGPGRVRFGTHYHRYGALNGTWQVRLWAKAKGAQPRTVRVGVNRPEWGEAKELTVGPEWRLHTVALAVDKIPEPQGPKDNPHLLIELLVPEGEVLVDDVEAWLEGDENPTVFRDDTIAMLKRYRPGCIRFLQMGGNTLRNTLMPPMRAHSFTSRRGDKIGPYAGHSKSPYSLHEMYELCEFLDAEPWYCLPGTLGYEEMAQFMEYLAAPADVGLGALRAELGHPEPWTESLKRIHVEFGNEAWNNAGPYQCGGFNGPGYWEDLIRIGKESPYYSPKIVFHAAGQAAHWQRNNGIMANVPNADRFGIAPYIIQRITESQMRNHATPEDLFRWAFAWPLWRDRDDAGAMFRNYRLSREHGIELSVYEVNHHITHGDGPLEPRNQIVTSIGGGLNVCNTMLQMLRRGVRTQALFSLVQHSYNAHNIGPVRLWGTALCMRQGQERYRPTFLACALANQVMAGDLVATEHSGTEPTFTATGPISRDKTLRGERTWPVLFSYAFRDGTRRGLLLVNLDTETTHTVDLRLPDAPAGPATRTTLTAAGITANNEYEAGDPQVVPQSDTVELQRNGTRLSLPPFSMQALTWTATGTPK